MNNDVTSKHDSHTEQSVQILVNMCHEWIWNEKNQKTAKTDKR